MPMHWIPNSWPTVGLLGISGYRELRPRASGLLHEVLHQAPFVGAIEINRARLKTVRPSSTSGVQAREREFEFS